MARYGKKASDKVEKSLHEMKRGELKSSSGQKVRSRKQAIAIGLSEARRAGGKVPRKPSAARGRSSTARLAARLAARPAARSAARATAARGSRS